MLTWNLNPVAFLLHFGNTTVPVYWYGLLFASTFALGALFMMFVFRREHKPVDQVYDLLFHIIIGTVVGSRLFHVLFYTPDYYITHPSKIVAVWEGGLASHGAVVGVIISLWLYARRFPAQPFLWIADRSAIAVPACGALIRAGNFCNAEILGQPSELPWAVVFMRIDSIPRHPVQIYEALCYLLIFFIQLRFYLRYAPYRPPGRLLGRFLVLVFGVRFIMEYFKAELSTLDSAWTLSMGQWLSIPAILIGIWLSIRPAPSANAPLRHAS
jgi:phosphatidylglycerol---prolipoprotein diacylglyceryl transferase